MFQVSIIIVNYNTFEYTYNCVKSIIEKTIKISYEIIVVDNASQNFHREKLIELSSSIKIILNDKNLGFSRANNIGIKESMGEVILLLNNDTYLVNDAISISYYRLMQEEHIGTIGCQLLNKNLTWQKSFYDFPSIKTQVKKFLRIKNKGGGQNAERIVDWITGAFLMFKKEHLHLFPDGKLNEEFFMYCEDIQWGFHFHRHHLPALYYPKGIVVHYHGKSSSIKSDIEKKLKFYYPNLAKLLVAEYGVIYAKTYFFLIILTLTTAKKNFSWNQIIKPLIKIWFYIK